MAEGTTSMQAVVEDLTLYPEEFVEVFGRNSKYWNNESWTLRELALRHHMCCLLLCNNKMNDDFQNILADETESGILFDRASQSTSSTSSGDLGDPLRYRYYPLEGIKNLEQWQHAISRKYGLIVPTKLYDIFDLTAKHFIELKVTSDYDHEYDEFVRLRKCSTSEYLIHINSVAPFEITTPEEIDKMPGEAKALAFLMKRQSIVQHIRIQPNFVEHENLLETIFPCTKFNEMVEIWKDSWYRLRNNEVVKSEYLNQRPKMNLPKDIQERQLANLIEDTSKREAPFMKLKSKLYPSVLTKPLITQEEKDDKMLEVLFEDLRFIYGEKSNCANDIVNIWNSNKKTFSVANSRKMKFTNPELARDLGIGMKGTTRFDNFSELIQPEYPVHEKKRYSRWMSNLMLAMSKDIPNFEHFFSVDLMREEVGSSHPMARFAFEVLNKFLAHFSQTYVAEYCSSVKNFYSRIGGAYLQRGTNPNKVNDVAIFPLYSTAYDADGNKTRRVSGFCFRGPQHARAPTDRIPFITVEKMNEGYRAYWPFLHKANFLTDHKGDTWVYRVNSCSKQDASYLTFVQNALYTTSNMIGEIAVGNPDLAEKRSKIEVVYEFIENHRDWLVERIVESVFMAVMGGSQEEGALAAIRKIFMINLALYRGKSAMCHDLVGFAESLNECLIDQPLALYFGEQARLSLIRVHHLNVPQA